MDYSWYSDIGTLMELGVQVSLANSNGAENVSLLVD